MCLYMCINVDGRKEKKKIERLRDVEDIFFDLVCFTKNKIKNYFIKINITRII